MQSSPILKSLPRRQRSLSEARALVIAWQASDQRKSAWCRSQGIIGTTLQSCLVRIRRADAQVRSSGFIAVHPPRMFAREAVSAVRIELGGGVQILGLTLAEVALVLRDLREERS